MVFYFLSNQVEETNPVVLYMGKDKFENEELIANAWPEDVWFHVDKLSSAHVYMRLPEGIEWNQIPKPLLEDCAQLVKANSIEGNKKNNISIVYTLASNLKKTGGMEVGQVGFHKDNMVKKTFVEKRVNEIVNRLNKTRTEKSTEDFVEETNQRMKQVNRTKRQDQVKKKKEEEELRKAREEEKKHKNYQDIFSEGVEMKSNWDQQGKDYKDFEDNFM